MDWMGPEKEFGRVRMIEVAGRDGWRRVEKGWAIAGDGPQPGATPSAGKQCGRQPP